MLYLAQVKQNPTSGEKELQLLARQQSQDLWDVIDSEIIPCETVIAWGEGALVLVELENSQKVLRIQEAKDWVMKLVETYLIHEVINSTRVAKEQEKVEQWRQEMTSRSLDLTRRCLELETQKEQVQELEAKLKKEREELEAYWAKIKESEAKINPSQEDY